MEMRQRSVFWVLCMVAPRDAPPAASVLPLTLRCKVDQVGVQPSGCGGSTLKRELQRRRRALGDCAAAAMLFQLTTFLSGKPSSARRQASAPLVRISNRPSSQ
jgi:hypothetical protein